MKDGRVVVNQRADDTVIAGESRICAVLQALVAVSGMC